MISLSSLTLLSKLTTLLCNTFPWFDFRASSPCYRLTGLSFCRRIASPFVRPIESSFPPTDWPFFFPHRRALLFFALSPHLLPSSRCKLVNAFSKKIIFLENFLSCSFKTSFYNTSFYFYRQNIHCDFMHHTSITTPWIKKHPTIATSDLLHKTR